MKSSYQFLAIFYLVVLSSSGMASDTLITQNPFLPPQSRAAVAKKTEKTPSNPMPPDRFLFRGILRLGDTFKFSIFDTKTKTSRWVSAGKVENDFCIVSYDPRMKELSFEWNGRKGQLKLETEEPLPLSVVLSINEAASSVEKDPKQLSAADTVQSRTTTSSQRRVGQTNDNNNRAQLVYFNKILSQPRPYQGANAYVSNNSTFASVLDGSVSGGARGYTPEHLRGSFGSVRGRNNVNNPDGKPPEHLN